MDKYYWCLCVFTLLVFLSNQAKASCPTFNVTNGVVTRSTSSSTTKATVKCNSGYALVGVEILTCKEDGGWSAAYPQCLRDCGQPNITAPVIWTTPSGTLEGSTVSFSCINNYETASKATYTCTSSGAWQGTIAVCELIGCPQAPSPINGRAVTYDDPALFGSSADYFCDNGYERVGQSTRYCMSPNGTWSGTAPTCEPVGKNNITDCNKFSVQNATVTYLNGTTYLAMATVTCNQGYTPSGTSYLSCSASGSWNGTKPSCTLVDCGSPGSLANGAVKYDNGTLYQSTVRYICNSGYSLQGQTYRACTADGTWSGSLPTCELIDCGSPGSLANGEVKYDNGTMYQSTVRYICNSGYSLQGQTYRACTADGTWSGSLPTCELIDCGSPASVQNGVVSTAATVYQSLASYTCNMGYTLQGQSPRTCTADGTWSGSPPVCQTIDCGAPENVTNGRVTTDGGTVYQSVALYTCNQGFTLQGERYRRCYVNSTWSGTVPTCQQIEENAVTCPETTDERGTVWQETVAGDTSVRFCAPAFTGNITRICGEDGTWKPARYLCVRDLVRDIQTKVSALSTQSMESDIVSVVKEIATVANHTTTSVPSKLATDAEMRVLSDALDTVATLIPNDTESATTDFLESASFLIDQNNKVSWQTLEYWEHYGAETVLGAVEKMAEKSGTTDEIVLKKNIAYMKQKTTGNIMEFPAQTSAGWLQSSGNKIWVNTSLEHAFVSYGLVYRNMTDVLGAVANPQTDDSGYIVNGPIIALTLVSSPDDVVEEVTVIIEHVVKSGYASPNCSFWNPGNGSKRGTWSTEGCSLVSTNSSFTVCKCNHLTNFAVLMSPFVPGDVSALPLRIVSIVGISISILTLLITLLAHCCLWRYLRSDRVTLLVNLCVALFVAYVVFLTGVDRTESAGFCIFIAALLHYIYLVVFFLMLAEGVDIAAALVFVFSKTRRIKYLIVAAWVLPAIIVGISLGVTKTKGYGNDAFCWLSVEDGLIWAFVGPAATVIVINIVCLVVSVYKLFQARAIKKRTKIEQMKTSVRSLCVLLPLMGVSWILGIFYINKDFYWIQYVFAVCNGLQGFFIFVFHCAFNKQIRKALKSRDYRSEQMKIASTLRATQRTNFGSSARHLASSKTDSHGHLATSLNGNLRNSSTFA